MSSKYSSAITAVNAKIPLWINVVQAILTLIMLQQVYLFYLDHEAVAASGIGTSGAPTLNLLFEFAARTATMAIVSAFVLISQNPRYFIPILVMNVLREGQETLIDPLYPLANAPMSPVGDLASHILIMAIEVWALIVMYRIVWQMDVVGVQAASTSLAPDDVGSM